MSDNNLITNVSYNIDESSKKRVIDANRDIARASNDASSNVVKGLRNQEKQINSNISALQKYERDVKSVKGQGVDLSGDIASSSAGLRGAIDVFSNGQATAVTGLLEITEAFADVGEFAPLASAQTAGLINSMTGLGVGAGVGALALGGVAVAVAGVAIALKPMIDEMNRAAETARLQYEAQKVVDDLRLQDATDMQVRDVIKANADEIRILEERLAQDRLELEEKNFNALDNLFNTEEEEYFSRISEREARLKELAAQQRELNAELENGTFRIDENAQATAHANVAEVELASARDNSSEATMRAKEAEREREQQAKEAEREREQQAREAEQNAKRARDAQQKYAKSVQDTNIALEQGVTDALQNAQDSLKDAQTSLSDDLTGITNKANIAQREARISAFEDDRKLTQDHYRTLRDLQKNTLRNEQDAVEERDFLALANARKQKERELEDAQSAFADARQDTNNDRRIANNERKRAFADEQRQRQQAYAIQARDLNTSLGREIRTAQTANERKLAELQRGYNAELQLVGGFVQNLVNLGNQASAGVNGGFGGGASVPIPSGGLGGRGAQAVFNRYIDGLQGAVNNSMSNTFNINGAQSPQATGEEVQRMVINTMSQLGFNG